MSEAWFIETLARNGEVRRRERCAALPIRLGRAYDNDCILDDAYIAPHHAEVDVDPDGALVMRDLGTCNGIVHRGRRSSRVVLDGHTVVRMGHTMVRVRSAQHAVAPELLDRTRHGFEGVIPGLIGLALIALLALFIKWIADASAVQPIPYLQAAAFAIVAALVWCGSWGLVNHQFGGHARMGRHLFIVGSALLALTAFRVASSVVAYAFSLEWLTRYSSHVFIAIACALLYYHLVTVNPQRGRRNAILCSVLFVLGSGLTLLSNVQRTGRMADELYMPLLLPPSLRASPDHSVDEFMGRARMMQARVDQERTRKVKDGEDEDD
jgi:hypothetical protein